MKHLFVYFALFLTLCGCSEKKERLKPSVADITESVYASGKIKADQQYNIYSTVNGVLKDVYVKAGDSVSIGTPLFRIDNDISELNAENSLLALQLSEQNSQKGSDRIKEAELAVSIAHQKYLLDSSLYIRQKKLWEQNIGSKLDLEQKEMSLDNSRIAYETARTKLNQLRLILDKEKKNAAVNYSISQKLASDYLIRSTVNGKVYDVLREKGELITPQVQLAVAGSATGFIIEMGVDENDIARIRQGLTVLVTMDSYKNEVFEGTVTEIYPIMNERSHTFTIKAVFNKQPPVLYPNLSLEANIVLHTKKNALVIPKEYLLEGKYVLINKDERKEVQTGIRDYNKVEITSGLDSSQFIYKPD